MRLDLDPSRKLLELLGRPDRSLRSVLVSGTNGKGSTCAFLTAIAKAAGLRVGTYTSPHLSSPVERIAIDGEPVDETTFAKTATELAGIVERSGFDAVTYFEFLTMMAVRIFAQREVDLAIFEVGLGGRLDTTNALERIGTITTSIDYDHTDILGNTLSKIAAEKGAIMRKNLPAVVAEQEPEAQEALLACAEATGSRLLLHARDFKTSGKASSFSFRSEGVCLDSVALSLLGDHQVQNAACASAMAVELSKLGFRTDPHTIEKGLKSANIPGRLERRLTFDGKEVWLDVAHNPGAAREIAAFFRNENLAPLDLVVGVLKDKDWGKMLDELLPIAKSITLCRPNSPRAWDLEEARRYLHDRVDVTAMGDPVKAFGHALVGSKRVLCTGSFYVVGQISRFRGHLT